MNWDLIGHEWAVQLLRGHIVQNNLRHAYLITGPSGVGKKTLAVKFVQAINCEDPVEQGIPCQACQTCLRIARMEHPDLFPVKVEEGSTQIKIDQIRELVHRFSLTPYVASRKIGLLINFEQANSQAQNSLLKTLEEPPGDSIMILTATSANSLLDTITSRCEEIRLNTVPISISRNGLEHIHGIPADQANFLAHISGGKPEIALHYHRDPAALELREILLNDHRQILQGNSVERFSYASKYEKDSLMVNKVIDTWSSLWHDIMHQSGKSRAPIQNIDRSTEIDQIVNRVNLGTAQKTLNIFRRAHSLLLDNANLKLTFEDLLLQLPRFENL
jgi:DNA polymerase-3 subunit delta'